MGRKLGAVPIWGGEVGPYLTQCDRVRGLLPRQLSSCSIQPLCHYMGRNVGYVVGAAVPPFFWGGGRGTGSLSNTMSPGPRPTSVLSGILILNTLSRWATTDMRRKFEGDWVSI